MKSLRLLSLLLLLVVALPDANAQVSVRRSSSRSESTARKKDKKDKDKDKVQDVRPVTPPPTQRATPVQRTEVEADAAPVRRETAPVRREAAPTRRTSVTQAPASGVDDNSQRLQTFNEYQRKDEGTRPWQHTVYRELDVTQGSNASLYYPVEPQDGLTNLFRVLIEGLCSGELTAYEYLDGREVFEKKYEIKVTDILDKFQIIYQQKPAVGQGGQPTYQVEEMDVPSNEVLSYYIKERWEYNLQNSTYGPRILAICPVMHRSGDFGGDVVRYPMFWINYEDVRPLLRKHLIMSDGMNNAPRFTMEEFFTLQQYEGDIYKVQNVRGLSLMQQYPDADSLKAARAKIEAQLRGFGDSIWVHEPTDAELAEQDSIAAAARAERRAARRAKNDDASASDSKAKRNRRTKEVVDTDAIEEAKETAEEEIDQRIEQTGKAHSAKRSARRR